MGYAMEEINLQGIVQHQYDNEVQRHCNKFKEAMKKNSLTRISIGNCFEDE